EIAGEVAEARGHDAEHHVRNAVEIDRRPDDTWIRSEQPVPDPFAQHDDARVAAGAVVLGSESPADDGTRPEEVEVRRGGREAVERHGVTMAEETHAASADGGKRGEGPRAVAKI